MQGTLINDENAVSITIGYILNILILIIFTGGIIAAFYLYADSSSKQTIRTGFTDLGSVIARDITNMYLTSEYSNDIVALNVKRDIPLTIGGKGYRIELKNASKDHPASVDIIDSGFPGYRVSTTLNSINNNSVNVNGIAYSGSGSINMTFKKNEGLWIK